MINLVTGNLFDSDAEALVNTVNCVGVMGRGIALQFKGRYPDNFKAYELACRQKKVIPGKMFIFEMDKIVNPRYIINFPTKRHWRGASRIEDIEAGLVDLAEVIVKRRIASIALPPLGSGLGGLEWGIIRDRIEDALKSLTDVNIEVYTPSEAAAAKRPFKNKVAPKMTPGRAALVSLVQRYLSGLLDPFVTLLEIHKLMYFLQESGEPLKLRFIKAIYGPFAENLSHVLKAIEGNLLSGYADGGDAPNKRMEIVPGAERDAKEFLAQNADTSACIAQVVKLVEGFETPLGMELLATVHWVAKNEAKTLPEIVSRTYEWGPRKRNFSDRQIRLAAQRLADQGWIQ
jgi:O-acetyl-ADP-ribose deacetylase (regulator of RNase III)